MKERIEKFIDRMKEDLDKLAERYPDTKSLLIDWQTLEKFDDEIADKMFSEPDKILPLFDEVLNSRNLPVLEPGETGTPEFHVKFFNIPKEKGYTVMIRDIDSDDVARFISTDGTINRISEVLPKVYVGKFKCIGCSNPAIEVKQERADRQAGNLRQPNRCPNCGKTEFQFLPEESRWVNFQTMEIQEPLELTKGGEQASKIRVWIEDDLTKKFTPGNKVIVTGVVRLAPPQKKGTVYTKFIESNNVESVEKEFEDIEISKKEEKEIKKLAADPLVFDKIIKSIAPSIYGYNEVKGAIALQMFGARAGKILPDGGTVRPDIHILLIGDPGVAKSRLLKFVDQIAPKSIFVSGKGTTGAGLTATAEKDELADGAWTLKAGALVLAGGGIACIDEFDKMDKDDRASMHEAMEQQSYHSKTRILLSDGSEKEIGGLVDGFFAHRIEEIIEIFTSDFSRIYKTSVDRVSRHSAPDHFIEITLQNGRKVTVTPEHPCWVIDEGRISTTPAEKIRVNDFLPIPNCLPLQGTPQEIKYTPSISIKASARALKQTRKIRCLPQHNDAGFCRLIGYLITDGGYELNQGRKAGVNFTNKDKQLIDDFCVLSETYFNIKPYVYRRSNGVFYARIISMQVLDYLCSLDPCFSEKSEHKRIPPLLMKSTKEDLRGMLSAMFECDGWVTDNRIGFVSPCKECCEQVQTLLLRFGIVSSLLEQKTESGRPIWRTTISGNQELCSFAENISFLSERKNKRLLEQLNKQNYRTIKDIIPNVGSRIHELSRTLKVDESKVLGYSITSFKRGKQNFSRQGLKKYASALEEKIAAFSKSADLLKTLTDAKDIKRVRKNLNVSLEDLEPFSGVSHQSLSFLERKKEDITVLKEALIKYCEQAKNTASDVAFLKGLAEGDVAWNKVRKVGVVPNKTEKWVYDVTVEPTRSFVSECMLLHNTISIAKAGIIAKFKCNTAILAAANPKFSRFDNYKPLGEQFDIPPTLLSRFDLIFPMQDVLDTEQDKNIAEHMLKMHKGGEGMKDLEPAISADLFRKYVAYARKNSSPILTEEAANKIRDYYVTLRASGKAGGAVTATPRQLEALVRLAESSAKIRLADKVTPDDADRAIILTNHVLKEIAMDKTTGQLDIDRIVTSHPKSMRDKIRLVEDSMKTLVANNIDKMASFDDIIELATSKDPAITRFEVEKYINELKTKGVIYEPRHNRFMFTDET
jgi:replicative DNA helicase Mcm